MLFFGTKRRSRRLVPHAMKKFGIQSRKMPKKDKAMNEAVAKQIDENLRRIYAQKVAEEIPERLQDLLRQLREKDKPQ
jgi:O-acetylhomoserine/O-acetylserine sulfhydrylase-like pyridoxal-dependent enzyme